MEVKIREFIQDADLVLIGLGREFEKNNLIQDKKALQALNRLADILQKKNYFVVSICTNDIAKSSDLQTDRVVQPCGTIRLKQCMNRCEEGLLQLAEEDSKLLESRLAGEEEKKSGTGRVTGTDSVWTDITGLIFGNCPKCGSPLVLNTVYTETYDENGYLKDWNRYTKWLQGTLNKKLCILELGVDLTYPSIIRWPFEKIAFYNQKAHFIRVNERLFHMSEEIKDKGISVPRNALEWLLEE